MATSKTITGIEINVTSNKSARTFTIRKEGLKYRTDKMNKQDFENNIYNTANDWADFLKYSGSYSIIK